MTDKIKIVSLSALLKPYDNILWYPSAGEDFSVLDVFSGEKLGSLLQNAEKCPECFILTDYDISYRNENYVIKGYEHKGCDSEIIYRSEDCTVTAFNHSRIRDINIGYDPEMVTFYQDGEQPECYGSVYAMDILIEYKNGSRYISKLVYVVAENTRFAYDFILKNRIKVKYLVRSCYGYGFGGGSSTGMVLYNMLNDLGVEFYADDLNTGSDDVADKYLTLEQRSEFPDLNKIANLSDTFGFKGYEDVILYRVD